MSTAAKPQPVPDIMKIYGPPGTGKTRSLLELFEQEIRQGTPPERIAFLTFTRAARAEAIVRTGRKEADLPYVRTIHSICYRQLGVTQTQMMRRKDLHYLGRQLGVHLTGNAPDPWSEEGSFTWEPPSAADMLLALNHRGRHLKIQLKEAMTFADPSLDYKYVAWFTRAYRSFKEKEELYDYTDLLSAYLERGVPLDVDVLFVDEGQDLSLLQWDVVRRLGRMARRWYVAGDDDQAIFTWAGASAQAFRDLRADETKTLDYSYRLPSKILAAAKAITDRIAHREKKVFGPRDGNGMVLQDSVLRDEYLAAPSSLVLFRNHYFGRQLQQQLNMTMVPYLGNQSPLEDLEVQAALRAWCKWSQDKPATSREAQAAVAFAPADVLALQAIQHSREDDVPVTWDRIYLEAPTRGRFLHQFKKMHHAEYIEGMITRHGWVRVFTPTVRLLSIHQAKGHEAHTVLLDTGMTKQTWEGSLRNPDDEHRVWYVGVTRAQERLVVLAGHAAQEYQL